MDPDAYDEQLQEDVFLGKLKAPPPKVKNTFIHYDVQGFESIDFAADNNKVWTSSPADLLKKSFHTKFPVMEELHNRGECKPCAYHVYKADGCRHGNSCPFCHLCTRGEIKRRKKERAKEMKKKMGEAQAARRDSKASTADEAA